MRWSISAGWSDALWLGCSGPALRCTPEILVLRHQLNALRRKSPKHLVFSNIDRPVFARLYGLTPSVRNALIILKPATVIAWHRAGFLAHWRWKSRPRGGRPSASPEVRARLREMSIANPLMRRAADTSRAAQARYLCRPDHRSKVHGEEKTAAVAGLEDLPLQSRGRHRAPVPREERAVGCVLSVPIL